MSEQNRSLRGAAMMMAAALFAYGALAHAAPHALVPIAKPHFTIDAVSPSIGIVTGGGPITAGSVLDAPGPVVTYPAAGLGLLNAADELDEFSSNRNDVSPGQTFVILFNVDRATVGAVGPDPSLLPNRPYNVLDQAQRHQAAGDTFMTLDGYTRAGGPLPLVELLIAKKNNTMVINQGDTGGIDDDLGPDVSPLMILPPGTPIDAIDGMGSDTPPPLMNPALDSRFLQTEFDAPVLLGPGPQAIYFTAKKTSPSLNTLPGVPSGANIYFDTNPLNPGTETLYAPAAQLGLIQGVVGDDIDGLIVFDSGIIGVFETGIDQILFSLAPGSPSLGGGVFSPADILVSFGGGVFNRFAHANDLGLLFTDNVTGLELLKTNDPATTAFNSAILKVIPGDYDASDSLTPDDCGQFPDCYTGEGGLATPPCEIFDQDSDGDVDCTDWVNFILIYKQLNGGVTCPLLSVDEFVLSLLGTPLHPAHTCMADINLDGKANGKDVTAYVRALGL